MTRDRSRSPVRARRCENPVIEHPEISWNLSPVLLLAIASYGGVYAWRFREVRREQAGRLPSGGRGHGRGLGKSGVRGAGWPQALAFGAGLLVLLLALVSPLDALGEEYLFSAHMVQHVMLGDIAPLLILLGLSRLIMRPATRRLQGLERAMGPFAHPATGIIVWLALIYFWHIPAMYDAALRVPALHGLEHISFFAAGVAVWWPLIQPVPMRRRLTGMWTFAYVGAAKAGLAALGLYLAWSSTVAYTYYETVPRIWGLSAIEDQNAGGAIMMVEQSIVLVLVFFALFVRMLRQSEEEELRRERLEDAAAA